MTFREYRWDAETGYWLRTGRLVPPNPPPPGDGWGTTYRDSPPGKLKIWSTESIQRIGLRGPLAVLGVLGWLLWALRAVVKR
jgi:hypothetical protein